MGLDVRVGRVGVVRFLLHVVDVETAGTGTLTTSSYTTAGTGQFVQLVVGGGVNVVTSTTALANYAPITWTYMGN